ncbi:hypothetical protein DRQ11_14470 [candidate division KSB1 bacterium]|nr:MAG: hypothetical protein DRQ11_14470 [candidate division KSB1 bacterium]
MHRFPKTVLLCLLLWWSWGQNLSMGQSPSFPLNHWVYNFLERMETKGLLTMVLNGTKPLTRREIAQYVAELLQNPKKLARLNKVEKEQVQFLKLEFREELLELGIEVKTTADRQLQRLCHSRWLNPIIPKLLFKNGRNLVSIHHEYLDLYLDPVIYRHVRIGHVDSLSHTERLYRDTHGIVLWGRLGKFVQFFFDFRDTQEWGTQRYPVVENYSLERLGYVKAKGSRLDYDETQAGLVFGHKFWQITLGKERSCWGPGYHGNLALSDWATSYDLCKLQILLRRLKFTAFTAFIRQYPPIVEIEYETDSHIRRVLSHKYLAAHRLEFSPLQGLELGIHETLIYGDRGLELAYVNPLNFYWSAEHYLGDQDNSTMGADFELTRLPNFKIYGELFLDDFSVGRKRDWHGNKWGLLGGIYVVDIFSIPNLDLRFEAAKLRPYVYTHRYAINQYKHFTTTLGHRMGPNSVDYFIELQYRLSKAFLVRTHYEYWKHGANPPDRNVGGDINLPWRKQDAKYQKSLDGEIERRQSLTVDLSYELLRNLYLQVNCGYRLSKNVLLPDNNRGNLTQTEWLIALAWNF